MIIANLEYVHIISNLNKVEGGMIEDPKYPPVDMPSIDDIHEAVKHLEGKWKDMLKTFPKFR